MLAEITWEYCQHHAEDLLCEGVAHLRRQQFQEYGQVVSRRCGNYLISLNNEPLYIGEASNLKARVRQQFSPASTFYKNYRRAAADTPITDFCVQSLETRIGRKEIEEFGISNIPCGLNRFQLGKRRPGKLASGNEKWVSVQAAQEDLLCAGERIAMGAALCLGATTDPAATPGIYLIRTRNDATPIYIGESSDVSERWHKAHRRSTYFSAFRRHVATDVLGFELQVRNGKAKYLDQSEEAAVTGFLDRCMCAFVPVNFGRYELEEHLIRRIRPQLNRKAKLDSIS